MNKRRPELVLLINIFAILILLIGYPLTILTHWGWHFTPNNDSTLYFILDILGDIIFIPTYYFGATLIVLRYWMIYYEIQFSNSSLNMEWKTYISNNMENIHKEKWFIQHRKTFGNLPFLMKRVIIQTSILSVILIAASIIYSPLNITQFDLYIYISTLLHFILFVILITIYKKMPFFHDTIYLYREFRLISHFWFATLFIFTMSITIKTIFGNHIVFKCIEYLSGMFIVFIVSFLSTFYVLYQFKYLTQRKRRPSQQNKLQNILQDNDLFELFMQHLIHEFSMESLLSLVCGIIAILAILFDIK